LGRKNDSLSNSLRKFATLRDMEKFPDGVLAEEIDKIQGTKSAKSNLSRYCKFGYVKVVAKIPPDNRIGRPSNAYALADYGRRTLSNMRNLVAAGLPPIPYKYKVPQVPKKSSRE